MNCVLPPPLAVTGNSGVGEACVVDEAAVRTGRHLQVLEELTGIGMRLAREVERLALAEEPRRDALPDPALVNRADGARACGAGVDFGLVFARIARAVRQTVALEARLASDAEARAAVGAAAQAGRAAAEQKRARQLKDRVRRLAEAAISAEAEGHEAESLRYDLDERLEDPDIDAELGWRPIGVIFAGICRDLGIAADLSRFTDAELGFDTAAMGRGSRAVADGRGDADRPPDRGDDTAGGGGAMAGSMDTNLPQTPGPTDGWPVGMATGRDPP